MRYTPMIYVHEARTREMYVSKMYAYEMHANEVHAHEMYESGNFRFVLKHPSLYTGPKRRLA
jgi:hypothetical protein